MGSTRVRRTAATSAVVQRKSSGPCVTKMVQYRPEVAGLGGTCRLKPGEVRALLARALEGVASAFLLQEAYQWEAVVARRKGAKFGEHRGRDGILHAQGPKGSREPETLVAFCCNIFQKSVIVLGYF